MLNRNTLLNLDDTALLRYCRQETFRSSGPGGQHRDKTDSAVRLTLESESIYRRHVCRVARIMEAWPKRPSLCGFRGACA